MPLDPSATYAISTRLLAECREHGVRAIAGYDFLGYHLAVSARVISRPGYPVSALYVREPKDHGTKKTVEGPRLEVDSRVAVIITDPDGLAVAKQRLCDVGYAPVVGLFAEARPAATPRLWAHRPVIHRISPTSVASGTFDLTIIGDGFETGMTERLVRQSDFGELLPGAILSQSGTQLIVRENLAPGTYFVHVQNSDGRRSNWKKLEVQ
jgi:hypothetical protein